MRLVEEKRPSRVSSRHNDCLPINKKLFPNLKEILELQRKRQLIIATDNLRLLTFFKDGIRRNCNQWSLQRRLEEIEQLNKRLNCSVIIPANRISTIMVNFPKELNQ